MRELTTQFDDSDNHEVTMNMLALDSITLDFIRHAIIVAVTRASQDDIFSSEHTDE